MSKHECPVEGCEASFESKPELDGHKGGKHVRRVSPGPIKHGTPAGWRAHQRREIAPCSACRTAWAKYIREYRSKNARKDG